MNKKPCLFKGLNVFAGIPDKFYPTVSGKIKNLYYETSGSKMIPFTPSLSISFYSDKANKGKCVVDLRSCTGPVRYGKSDGKDREIEGGYVVKPIGMSLLVFLGGLRSRCGK